MNSRRRHVGVISVEGKSVVVYDNTTGSKRETGGKIYKLNRNILTLLYTVLPVY